MKTPNPHCGPGIAYFPDGRRLNNDRDSSVIGYRAIDGHADGLQAASYARGCRCRTRHWSRSRGSSGSDVTDTHKLLNVLLLSECGRELLVALKTENRDSTFRFTRRVDVGWPYSHRDSYRQIG